LASGHNFLTAIWNIESKVGFSEEPDRAVPDGRTLFRDVRRAGLAGAASEYSQWRPRGASNLVGTLGPAHRVDAALMILQRYCRIARRMGGLLVLEHRAGQRRHDRRGSPLGRPYGFCSGWSSTFCARN